MTTRRTSGAWLHLALFVLGIAATAAEADLTERYEALLSSYVTPDGVRYASWREVPADVEALSTIVSEWSAARFADLAPAERYATYINLYNAKILELVLRESPRESIKELSRGKLGYEIFFRDVLEIAGERISLNALEQRLRDESNDPRIHFAVNCASRSCPPIAAQAYRADRLEAQLERQTRSFLAQPGAVEIVKTNRPRLKLRANKIFDWYREDFENAGGVVAFIASYAPPDIAAAIERASAGVKLSYADYDWSLNEAP